MRTALAMDRLPPRIKSSCSAAVLTNGGLLTGGIDGIRFVRAMAARCSTARPNTQLTLPERAIDKSANSPVANGSHRSNCAMTMAGNWRHKS